MAAIQGLGVYEVRLVNAAAPRYVAAADVDAAVGALGLLRHEVRRIEKWRPWCMLNPFRVAGSASGVLTALA